MPENRTKFSVNLGKQVPQKLFLFVRRLHRGAGNIVYAK